MSTTSYLETLLKLLHNEVLAEKDGDTILKSDVQKTQFLKAMYRKE